MNPKHDSKKMLLIAFLLLLTISGCGKKTHDTLPNPNMGVAPYRVKTGELLQNAAVRNTIRIGTEGNYPPFSYRDKTAQLTGFDVEIAEEVARHMEMKAVFVEASWKDLLPGLIEGKYDAVFNEIDDHQERRNQYDFSNAYMTSTPVLVVRSDDKNIHTFSDLKGIPTAVETTGEYQQIASKYQSNIMVTPNFMESAGRLVQRQVDAVLTDSLSMLNLQKHDSQYPIKTVDSLDHVTQVCAAFSKGNSDLVAAVDNALETMQADGSYLAIWNKYFGNSSPTFKGIINRHK